MIDNKQKAKYILEEYANCYSEVDVKQLAECLNEIKAETYKEFAERLDKEFSSVGICNYGWVRHKTRKVLKELVGEQPILNDVKCIDCEYLELELPYAVCSKAYKGIVAPDDSCGKGKLKELVGEDNDL